MLAKLTTLVFGKSKAQRDREALRAIGDAAVGDLRQGMIDVRERHAIEPPG